MSFHGPPEGPHRSGARLTQLGLLISTHTTSGDPQHLG